MCGVFGYVGHNDRAPQLILAGLKKLEYRGYDSWGIAARACNADAPRIKIEKHVGKIGGATTSLDGACIALGHTRWATHGGVSQVNAHPHPDCHERLAVIHNGIVENHEELRQALIAAGHTFRSATDTEVIAHLLEDELEDVAVTEANDGTSNESALLRALMTVFRRLEGLNAVAVVDARESAIAAAKNGSPLVVGASADGVYLASDSSALLEHTRKLTFLEDGQAALLTPSGLTLYQVDTGLKTQDVRIWDIQWREEGADLGGHPHFLSKEIHEQPALIRRLAEEARTDAVALAQLIQNAEVVHFVGCGTAAHAAKVGEYLLSRIAARQVSMAVGSEFGYLEDFLNDRSLVVGLSQSGETIDLLDSLKRARARGACLAALVNVEGSSLYRLVDHPILLNAGPERCVLATKSFTAKLAVLLLTAYAAAGRLEEARDILMKAADEMQAFLTDDRMSQMRTIAERICSADHLYVIGRGPSYPLALEAALKVKEVTYMHAEGFAAGELKHGVIALIEEGTPCIVLAPHDETFRAIVSGAEEIRARGGDIIGISPEESEVWDEHIRVADVGEGAVLVNALPPQILAYEIALLRGLDPDKPRNLAKSVTVK